MSAMGVSANLIRPLTAPSKRGFTVQVQTRSTYSSEKMATDTTSKASNSKAYSLLRLWTVSRTTASTLATISPSSERFTTLPTPRSCPSTSIACRPGACLRSGRRESIAEGERYSTREKGTPEEAVGARDERDIDSDTFH